MTFIWDSTVIKATSGDSLSNKILVQRRPADLELDLNEHLAQVISCFTNGVTVATMCLGQKVAWAVAELDLEKVCFFHQIACPWRVVLIHVVYTGVQPKTF